MAATSSASFTRAGNVRQCGTAGLNRVSSNAFNIKTGQLVVAQISVRWRGEALRFKSDD